MSTTEAMTGGSEVLSSDRLTQFQDEVTRLRVSGGAANPERTGTKWGAGLAGVGAAIAIVALVVAASSDNTNDKLDAIVAALAGVALATVGAVVWVRNSMTRYLRYWLIRLVYEQREQTDRIVDALKGR